jgi:Zn-dependent membrane protease YugP
MYYEPVLYLLAILSLAFSLWAQVRVSSTFRKYSVKRTACGDTAAKVARMILDRNGLYSVRIERVGGDLTDHYDPRAGVLRLSDSVHDNSSAAAIGVAAHEAGHAVQHAVGYLPIKIRSTLVPVTSFASRFSWIVIILGVLLLAFDPFIGYYALLVGVGLFSLVTLFQLVTLPCELDASKRAMQALRASGRYMNDELVASRKVLTAAALTYVAALATSIIQLLRLLAMLNNSRKR